jgi:hypothetical protein
MGARSERNADRHGSYAQYCSNDWHKLAGGHFTFGTPITRVDSGQLTTTVVESSLSRKFHRLKHFDQNSCAINQLIDR